MIEQIRHFVFLNKKSAILYHKRNLLYFILRMLPTSNDSNADKYIITSYKEWEKLLTLLYKKYYFKRLLMIISTQIYVEYVKTNHI